MKSACVGVLSINGTQKCLCFGFCQIWSKFFEIVQ